MQVHIFLLFLLILILHEGKLNLSSTSLFCWIFFSYNNKILVNFRVLVNTHTEHLLSAHCVTKICNTLFLVTLVWFKLQTYEACPELNEMSKKSDRDVIATNVSSQITFSSIYQIQFPVETDRIYAVSFALYFISFPLSEFENRV